MLFYHFDVVRNSPSAPAGQAKEARVMIRAHMDVQACTDTAVQYLRERGWEITGVRRAQQADSPSEFASEETLFQLYQDAADQGIACAIVASRRAPELAYAEAS